MLAHFLIGAALGAATGMPIGAVGAAVIDAAYRHPFRRAVAVGLGGGAGDLTWAAIGALGAGPLLASHPGLPPVLYAVSGVGLIVYGAFLTRRARTTPAATETPTRDRGHARSGFATGLGLVAANPGNLVMWVVMVGGFLAGSSRADAVAAVVGIGIGSATWFVVLAHIARRGARLAGSLMERISRVVGVLLIGYGLLSVARGACYWACSSSATVPRSFTCGVRPGRVRFGAGGSQRGWQVSEDRLLRRSVAGRH